MCTNNLDVVFEQGSLLHIDTQIGRLKVRTNGGDFGKHARFLEAHAIENLYA